MNAIFQEQIDRAAEDFRKWKKDDLCVCFPIITDLHSNLTPGDPRICMKRFAAGHLELLPRFAEAAGADFAADLGDEGFDVPLRTEEDCKQLLGLLENAYRNSPVPVIHCIGNHDLYFPSRPIPPPEMTTAFWGAWLRKINRGKTEFTTGDDGSYGFYDIPGKPCRVFFLNTSDDPGKAGFSAGQLDFLRGHLADLPKDHTAVVLTHICPLTRARWKHYPPTDQSYRFPELSEILSGFTANGGRLAGVFSGDSHFDFFDFEDGVNYFVTQGYGGASPKSELPPQSRIFHQFSETLGRSDTFDMDEYCLLDLVGIKLEKREIRIFRAGAGGFNYYRGAKF